MFLAPLFFSVFPVVRVLTSLVHLAFPLKHSPTLQGVMSSCFFKVLHISIYTICQKKSSFQLSEKSNWCFGACNHSEAWLDIYIYSPLDILCVTFIDAPCIIVSELASNRALQTCTYLSRKKG